MMKTPIYQVDAFTSQPFSGNPAAVCLLTSQRSDEWMLNTAREMNLSETAFLLPEGDGYRLRWFTPALEVDLCGHATLASAHILWETGKLPPEEPARFYTRSGLLTARKVANRVELDFPARPMQPAELPDGLAAALGIPAPRAAAWHAQGENFLIELDSEAPVRAAQPNFDQLKAYPIHGVILTSEATQSTRYDFVSRFFAPRWGVNEDPVTGSAHCYLAPYWSERMGKTVFSAYQASARGGELRVRLDGERVFISGEAVTVLSGSLHF
nr:PhzF family phenazine biosynthesis protein [Ornatilinea apprima]